MSHHLAPSDHLAPVIAASAEWLVRVYAADSSPVLAALAAVQARQAATVAAWLRYPTGIDAALVHMAGPGGAARLDALVAPLLPDADHWRSWVDEVVVSWAACVLAEADVARAAVSAVAATEHVTGLSLDFRPLLAPDRAEARAGALLRHPDLLHPVASLHRAELLSRLGFGEAADTPAA